MIENLKDTVELMLSEDYKERFEGEVLQLCIRINRLRDILIYLDNGTAPFNPNCGVDLLKSQLKAMEELLQIYSIRMPYEGCEQYLESEPEYIIAMKAAGLHIEGVTDEKG